jgi:hypothetical protein
MPFLDLAATRNVRYPDPSLALFRPNGTFVYSAYEALVAYYDPRPDDPELAGYQFILVDLPANPGFGPGSGLDFLLFGTDYPALIETVSTYISTDTYTSDGNIYLIKQATFDESTLSVLGTAQANYSFNLAFPEGAGSVFTGEDYYKRILSGKTATNGVPVSGFAVQQGVADRGLYAQFTPPADPEFLAPLTLTTRVLTNTPVVYSTSPYAQIQTQGDGEPPLFKFRQPVILWEPDLTQEIADNGFVIEDAATFCGLATLDVVGLWSKIDYSPLYVPPTVAPAMARMAEGDSAPAGSTQADRHDAAKAALIEIAAARAASVVGSFAGRAKKGKK